MGDEAFALPFEVARLVKIIEPGFTDGDYLVEFGKLFEANADANHARHAFGLDSGQQAIEIALVVVEIDSIEVAM
jgi:hypothetical protein